MAEFRQELQNFKQFQRGPYIDMDMQLLSQFAEQSPMTLGNFSTIDFSIESFLPHQQCESASNNNHVLPSSLPAYQVNPEPVLQHSLPPSAAALCHESKKRKLMEQPKNNSRHSSSAAFSNDLEIKNSLEKRKRERNSEREAGRSVQVIHVRARRGQATDSHSLAERVRREKINSRLRRLQDLVPGCYKAMGMAGMLDEIINYVHSLQNQVEFLSMELASASAPHSFNQEISKSAGDKYI